MDNTPELLEALWNDLLSRQTDLIRKAFDSLSPSDQKNIRAHLKRMVRDAGWQPEQRVSAKAALQALKKLSDQGE